MRVTESGPSPRPCRSRNSRSGSSTISGASGCAFASCRVATISEPSAATSTDLPPCCCGRAFSIASPGARLGARHDGHLPAGLPRGGASGRCRFLRRRTRRKLDRAVLEREGRCMTGRVTLEPLGDGVRLLTLRRPEKLNALSWEMVEQIIDAAAEVRADRSVRALVLTGEGRGFCSGIDLGGSDAVGTADGVVEVLDRQERLAEMAVALRELPQPAIAAVNGPAAGGGLALALACDARICAPTARFNVAFVRIGLSGCDVGVSYMLP